MDFSEFLTRKLEATIEINACALSLLGLLAYLGTGVLCRVFIPRIKLYAVIEPSDNHVVAAHHDKDYARGLCHENRYIVGPYWGCCERHKTGGAEAPFSANISFAWLVVERLQHLEFWLRIIAGRNGKWEPAATVEVGKLPDLNGNPSRMIAQINAVDVPEAICKMALVAILEG